ncbi:MAG: glycoside hydrolase family 97 N-terminal domain-containing protein [Planctomycetota bacterium]
MRVTANILSLRESFPFRLSCGKYPPSSLFWLVLMSLPALSVSARPVPVASPDGRLQCVLEVRDIDDVSGVPCYRVVRDGKTIVQPSRLGMVIDDPRLNSTALSEGFTPGSVKRTGHDSTWQPVYGERSTIRDHHRQARITLRSTRIPGLKLVVTLRVYNTGVAICYQIPAWEEVETLEVQRERTEFRFDGDWRTWAVYSAQGVYEKTRIGKLRAGCERPLVLRDDEGLYLAIAEARLVDFARMKLAPLKGQQHALVSDLSGTAVRDLPFRSPWRVIMVADSPGELLENNDIILNLNDPVAIDDTSWIKPGKVIREVTLTTTGGKACVDFAVDNGLQYVEFDAGWYGHENDETSDATTVSVDPKRSPGPLDLHEVIRYADKKGIGILVYVNRRALERQLDEILPLYQTWGIKGVKYGFVKVGSQQWTTWLHAAVRKAAEHQLMVDIHDEYRPTGYSRTYPNLMTQEGIGGDETSPTNEQTLTILFTRMVAGAGDNTICYFNERVDRNACHAYQLAKAVCIYSPLQFLYWYDRPAGSPGTKGGAGKGKGIIGEEPELEFFGQVPTVWDETRVLHGAIGRYAVMARRSGDTWFVGAMNGPEQRSLKLSLDFLDANREYRAHIYRHDPSMETRTHVRIERRPVRASCTFDLELAPNRGQAMRIVPR